jgi:hypothetical protein
VDGQVGPLTWRSLTNPKPVIEPPSAIRYDQMPPEEAGGSYLGRAGLVAAIDELKAGACEIGGNNQGPWVRKYLEPVGLEEGNSWCSSFVSWCFFRACDNDLNKMSFPYSPGARDLMGKFKKKAWAYEPQSGYGPLPGDVVFWWRVSLSGWQGHVGLIHQLLVLFKKPFCILFQNLRQNLRICAPDVLERKVTHNQNHNGNPDHEKF